MLALTRKKNESVVINGDVKIVVVEIRGDKVRLGIEAPADVPVYRSEVWAKIQAGENARLETETRLDDGAPGFEFAAKTEERERGETRKTRKIKRCAPNSATAQIFAENAEFAEKTLRRRGDEPDGFDENPIRRVDETESTDDDPTSICRFPFE